DRCTAITCSLWPYRFGTNPFSNRKGNARALIRARGAKQGKGPLEDEDAPGTDHRQGAQEPVEGTEAPPQASGALGGAAVTHVEAAVMAELYEPKPHDPAN